MKGWRTLLVNAAMATGAFLGGYLLNIKWEEYVNPSIAIMIVAAINAGLRYITTGPVGEK